MFFSCQRLNCMYKHSLTTELLCRVDSLKITTDNVYAWSRRDRRGVSRLSYSTTTMSQTTIFCHFSRARVEIKNAILSNYVGNPLSGLHQLRYDLFLKLFGGIRPFFQEVVNESTAIRLRAPNDRPFRCLSKRFGVNLWLCGFLLLAYFLSSSELIMLGFFPLGRN